ncbi:MAG: YceH family protein [Solirubrobacteraceae bacterium]
MHFGELTASEQRVLGCLIEKRWTTPDQYPLTLNALRLACNQSTNRDPVTTYGEPAVRDAAQRLCRYGLARLASGHGSRVSKYRHLAEEALGLGQEELALLAVLLLRGPQTPGELKSRSERMAQIASLQDVERILVSLAGHGYARRLERRPGQKEDRYEHLMGVPGATAGAGDEDGASVAGQGRGELASTVGPSLLERVAMLETEVAGLRAEVVALRGEGAPEPGGNAAGGAEPA